MVGADAVFTLWLDDAPGGLVLMNIVFVDPFTGIVAFLEVQVFAKIMCLDLFVVRIIQAHVEKLCFRSQQLRR